MSGKARRRFDVAALRRLAGETVFARGAAYHREGRVVLLGIDPERVLAEIGGTEDYRAELRGRGNEIAGRCSCPAFSDWGFCKHLVAVALAANEAGPQAAEEGADRRARIREHLRRQGVDALAEMILDMADHDPSLLRKLEVAAAPLHADDRTLAARLAKAIDGVTSTSDHVGYREAAGWAADVEAVLDAVADLAASGRAGIAIELAERALDRIENALAFVDDSNGHGGALLQRVRDIHIAAALSVRPDPVALARVLFARELEDSYGTFDGAAARYAEALGKAGLAEYRRLAAEAWQKLPAANAERAERSLPDSYRRLERILDFFAEREGDLDARIALRTKDLSSAWRYLQLAEFCLAEGRAEEALRWAEEGLWLFDDSRADDRLLFFAAELLAKAGRKPEAEAHLWRAFDRAPSFEIYRRLRAFGGKAAVDRMVVSLEARLGPAPPTPWHHPADLLVEILTAEKRFDPAWAVLHKHGVSATTREALARASERTHPREALATYAARIERLAAAGGNAAYGEAVALVARMARLHGAAEHVAYITTLKQRFARKRNFMKLLG